MHAVLPAVLALVVGLLFLVTLETERDAGPAVGLPRGERIARARRYLRNRALRA